MEHLKQLLHRTDLDNAENKRSIESCRDTMKQLKNMAKKEKDAHDETKTDRHLIGQDRMRKMLALSFIRKLIMRMASDIRYYISLLKKSEL